MNDVEVTILMIKASLNLARSTGIPSRTNYLNFKVLKLHERVQIQSINLANAECLSYVVMY